MHGCQLSDDASSELRDLLLNGSHGVESVSGHKVIVAVSKSR